MFIIEARDANGKQRTTGGDVFEVQIRSPTQAIVEVDIDDLDDGRYKVFYPTAERGDYTIYVTFNGTFGGAEGELRGFPITAAFHPDADPTCNVMNGALIKEQLRDDIKQLRDFTQSTLDGLRQRVADGSLDELLAVKEHLLNVQEQDPQVKLTADRLRAMIEWLRTKEGVNIHASVEHKLRDAEETWTKVHRQVPVTKGAIAPMVRTQAALIRSEIMQYEKRIVEYSDSLISRQFWQYHIGPAKAQDDIKDAAQLHKAENDKCKRYAHLSSVFEYPEVMEKTLTLMSGVSDQLRWVEELWTIVVAVDEFIEDSALCLWQELDADSLEDTAKGYLRDTNNKLHTSIRWCEAFQGLLRNLKNFLKTVPLIQSLRHPSMRTRHWHALQEVTQKDITPPDENPMLKLQDLLSLNLHEHSMAVEEITDRAVKEHKMEENLRKLEEQWETIDWVVEPFANDSIDVSSVRMQEEDFEQLENDVLMVHGMTASRYADTFKDSIMDWDNRLKITSEVVQLLAEVQRGWPYLEPLFMHSDEVKRELPEAAKKFAALDGKMKGLLATAVAKINVVETCTTPRLQADLEEQAKLLEECKKALTEFLDGKRRQFPRFYFVSEADLLDTLSKGSNPLSINNHITKVFLATRNIQLEPETDDQSDSGQHTEREGEQRITAARALSWESLVGNERVLFAPEPLRVTGKVEVYLKQLLQAQYSTLNSHLKASYARFMDQERLEWLLNRRSLQPFEEDEANQDPDAVLKVSPFEEQNSDAAQIAILVAGMRHVESVEKAFDTMADGNPGALDLYYQQQLRQLTDLIKRTRTPLIKGDRIRIMVMITMDAHNRDVVEGLHREEVTSKLAFQWQSQLKQRFVDGSASIEVFDARFNYGYEYLGNGPRLVITPLTDRIYVTATQALNLKMGCAPAGPAGTGKTETTKDLASALGKCCYVFNCSPEMDYQSMGNIFKGLAASGSWGCFDEFNRLIPEVLSVCSVQFKAVCDGIRANKTSVEIEGDRVALDHTAGAFITMNPGYLGRSNLPEGLKSLFRPITVMVPDLVLICENMLMAEGFEEAKVLARKFYALYSLLRELLSKQSHYDWGLRAVKSVLVVAGTFKRAEPDLGEHVLLLRALRDFNAPKIVAQDEVVFKGLLGDLFPGINPPRKEDAELTEAIKSTTLQLDMWPEDEFVLKTVQLDELLGIRHCVFMMGPPGCGKSTVLKVLADARGSLTRPVVVRDINPKAVSTDELYGSINMATREWREGLLSTMMRDLGNLRGDSDRWIVLDGDLDANWIESMNSVMDDNRMLTLANNERIPLTSQMRLIFEIRDLAFATPATVSRAGILYISTASGNQWRNLIAAWIQSSGLPTDLIEHFNNLLDTYCAPVLTHLKKTAKHLIPLEPTTMIRHLLANIEVLLPHKGQQIPAINSLAEHAISSRENDPDRPLTTEEKTGFETIFVFAAVWAFGGLLSEKDGEDHRALFSQYWRATWKNIRFPSRDTVFDYWLNPKTGKLDQWKNSTFFYTVTYDPAAQSMSQVTVPTPETAAITFWADQRLQKGTPVMLAGSSGSGKTQILQGLLRSQNPADYLSHTINFNFFTNARSLQANLESVIEKKTGNTYGPPGTAKMVYFVDDINLPEVDPYNTQSAIALIRQHLEYGHWYDLSKLTAKQVVDTRYTACLNPTAGSYTINPRLQRHFFSLAVGFPSPTSLHTIYQTFLDGHLLQFPSSIQQLGSTLINAALAVHTAICSAFRKTAKNFHYEFNIRHLSGVFQGLLVAQPGQFDTPDKFVQLWAHESERVYADRLVTEEDTKRFRLMMQSQVKKRFPQYNISSYFTADNPESLVFCHFAESMHDKMYDKADSMEVLSKTLTDALTEYNETNPAMDLVLFDDAIKHVCRISRIINNPSGHALLVGVGGSGKRSLARLAAFLCGYSISSLGIHSNYSMNDLKEDLKTMYFKAGIKDEGVAFLLTDNELIDERFLIYINDLLASGSIPDLYSAEERDSIANTVVGKVKAARMSTDAATCWEFFLNQVRKNLHAVLCFSPVGDDFRVRCTRFPALVNCTVIDWFRPWPEAALRSVAERFMDQILDLGSGEVRDGINRFMPFSFNVMNKYVMNNWPGGRRTNFPWLGVWMLCCVQRYETDDLHCCCDGSVVLLLYRMCAKFLDKEKRFAYTTPKSYLELLKLYQKLLSDKRAENQAALERLSTGLMRLQRTHEDGARIEIQIQDLVNSAEQKAKV